MTSIVSESGFDGISTGGGGSGADCGGRVTTSGFAGRATVRRRTGSGAATAGGGTGVGGRCSTSSDRAPFVLTESGSP